MSTSMAHRGHGHGGVWSRFHGSTKPLVRRHTPTGRRARLRASTVRASIIGVARRPLRGGAAPPLAVRLGERSVGRHPAPAATAGPSERRRACGPGDGASGHRVANDGRFCCQPRHDRVRATAGPVGKCRKTVRSPTPRRANRLSTLSDRTRVARRDHGGAGKRSGRRLRRGHVGTVAETVARLTARSGPCSCGRCPRCRPTPRSPRRTASGGTRSCAQWPPSDPTGRSANGRRSQPRSTSCGVWRRTSGSSISGTSSRTPPWPSSCWAIDVLIGSSDADRGS